MTQSWMLLISSHVLSTYSREALSIVLEMIENVMDMFITDTTLDSFIHDDACTRTWQRNGLYYRSITYNL